MSAAEAAKQAARITDPVEHGLGMLGMFAGMLLGAVIGGLILGATIATGGAFAIGLAALGAVGAVAGGGLAMGQLVNGISTLLGFSGITTGNIIPATSFNVKVGGLFSARAQVDGAICSGLFGFNHPPMPKALIATGSSNVRINSFPAARQSDKLVCAADIKQGYATVRIGGGTVQVLPIHDAEAELRNILGVVALGALVGMALMLGVGYLAGAVCGAALFNFAAITAGFFAVNEGLGVLGDALGPGWKDTLQGGFGVGALVVGGAKGFRDVSEGGNLWGEPIQCVTGEVVTTRTDILLPGALALELKRTYASGSSASSCLGPKWSCTWGQYVEQDGAYATLHTADARVVAFEPPEDGWARHPMVDRLRLRRAAVGFEVRDDAGRQLTFSERLGARWMLTRVADRNGCSIQFFYGGNGELVEVRHSGGYRLAIDATATQIRRVVLVEDNGRRTELVRYEYDGAGGLAAVIDGSGLPFRYSYDSEARLTRWEDRNGNWYEYRYDQWGRCIHGVGIEGMYDWRFDYDHARRMNTATDSLGNRTSITYNSRLQIVGRTDARGGVTLTEWDERSNLLMETDPLGGTRRYEYDKDGDLLSGTDALGRTTRILRDGEGRPALVTDAAGSNWVWRYDERGNLIEAGLEGELPWRYERDEHGNVLRVVDPIGLSRSFAYDGAGLATLATDWEGNITSWRRDGQGRVVEERDSLGRVTGYSYRRGGKLEQVTYATGVRVRFAYDAEGNLLERRLPDGRTYRYSYGAFDLLREVVKPSGARFRLEHDAEARVAAVFNERDEGYRYTYDATGQVSAEVDFAGREIRYEYDLAGRLVRRVNGAGEETEFERDRAGQLVGKRSTDGLVDAFAYDPMGRFVVAKSGAVEVSFERDVYGRVVREQQGERSVDSTFDLRGLRETRTGTQGQQLAWIHDANGRVAALRMPGDERFDFVRDAAGREVERRLRGGFVLRQEFDPLDQLVSQWAGVEAGAAAAERSYRYNDSGDPIEIRDGGWGVARFAYDADGRIARSERERGVSEAFAYDAAGDMVRSARAEKPDLSAVLQVRVYGTGGRLERFGGTRYEYDADGRVVEKREAKRRWRYEWSTEGRLRTVLTPEGDRWRYEYDAFGRRVSKQCVAGPGQGSRTEFLWDGDTVAEEISGSGAACWAFEPGTFRPVAKQENGKTYACVTDQIGTPRELVTVSGEVGWSARFTTWGEVEEKRAPGTECALRFQGQWWDEESGLSYNWNRYYDAGAGSYVSPDPIGLSGGSRTYGYVRNPLAWVDPWGLAGCTSWNDFQSKTKGSGFSDRSEAATGWQAYKQAYNSPNDLSIGRLPDTQAANAAGRQILDLPSGWTPRVNDAWVQGGIDRSATFNLESPLTPDNLTHPVYGQSVFGREVSQIENAGYTRTGNAAGDQLMPPTTGP